jgi:phage shock protein PspC (stress-responsive transcriptional regulator)
MKKRLYRSQSDRMLWGVCGGLSDYFDVDTTIVRLISVLMLFLGGFVILAYIICAIVIPLEPSKDTTTPGVAKPNMAGPDGTIGKKDPDQAQYHEHVTVGLILIVVGVLFLAGLFNLFWWFRWGGFWAFALVLIGVLIVLASRKR